MGNIINFDKPDSVNRPLDTSGMSPVFDLIGWTSNEKIIKRMYSPEKEQRLIETCLPVFKAGFMTTPFGLIKIETLIDLVLKAKTEENKEDESNNIID